MLRMRRVIRSAFRFAAAIEPPPLADSGRRPWVLDPRHLTRAGLVAARFGAELLETFWRGSHVGPAYIELDNKVRAFRFFETVGVALELGDGPLEPGLAIRDAESRLGHEPSVWATEGIGYELLERRRQAGQSARGLLGSRDDSVPVGCWTTLHTGMGMALADEAMGELGASSRGLRQALEEYIERCAGAARAGYVELAFEPLGLVARLLDPALVPEIARALSGIGGPWSDLFWHGVGRGLYFLPANLPPACSAPWAGLRACLEEPPDGRGRNNAAAGFSWAVTLVNLRHPAVVEGFLAHHAEAARALDPAPPPGSRACAGPAREDPVAQGVASALLLWHEASGGSKELRRFLGHVAAPERRGLWERVVRAPFEEALERWRSPEARADPRRLPELFRYR
jgi:hypothetical protein